MWDKIKEALNAEMIDASRRMSILEHLEGKSPDYIAGFFAGINDQTAYTNVMLAPIIEDMREHTAQSRKARGA